MTDSKFKKHREKWQTMSKLWRLLSSPGRPSREDLKNYDKFLKIALQGKKNAVIVVYGSTPEIRDLLSRYSQKQGAKVSCLEMTKDMFIAMTSMVKKKNNREKFVEGNWIVAAKVIKPGSVDVCIGDYLLGNIGGHESEFFSQAKKILKSDGYFITRNLTRAEKQASRGPEKELKKQAKRVAQGKLSVRVAAGFFANNLLLNSSLTNEKATLLIYDQEIRALQDKISSLSKTEQKVFRYFCKSWWMVKEKFWTYLAQKKGERMMKKYFKIRKILYSSDYDFAEHSPFYLLSK
ncbi:MAG: class I SAM-dependent methyltransferase [Patescibacteria group bacterium]|nr:class I SAM-dependent methyltransferase [Patescibacteria group bacterium]